MKKRTLFCLIPAFSLLFLTLSGCAAKKPQTEESGTAPEATAPDATAAETVPETEKLPVTLKIGSYNIKNGLDVGYDYTLLADDIVNAGLDVCGLQEVDRKTARNGNRDTMKLLSRATGYEYYEFSKAIPYQGGEYGTAILSRYPIVSFEVIPLESDGYEQRSLGHAVLDVDGTLVDYFNTHLSYENKETRAKQFLTLAEQIAKTDRWILTADFNTDDFTEFAVIDNSLLVNNAENRMLSYAAKSAIDNIVLPSSASVTASGMLDSVSHSDHVMIWAEIVLQ
ncbi:MAG: endonuclease/exonuclease/phosphatase family protein [Lachnospiraceae bacterium]|nr:endonuclease/exonuclease/phosphatase family protein [Lachnospiraceae bacterium]